jgi:hypothetical protein
MFFCLLLGVALPNPSLAAPRADLLPLALRGPQLNATVPAAEEAAGTSVVISPGAVAATGAAALPEAEISLGKKKGLVVAFLSAACPCSNSHNRELAALAAEYPEFAFVGVHSNPNELRDFALAYFKKAGLPFPVIRDRGGKLAGEFKALKTPHAFVVLPSGEAAYRGGVSSSRQFDPSVGHKYLREALEDLSANPSRPVRTPEGRTLGCAIARGIASDW